jgi:hypothetical protein
MNLHLLIAVYLAQFSHQLYFEPLRFPEVRWFWSFDFTVEHLVLVPLSDLVFDL